MRKLMVVLVIWVVCSGGVWANTIDLTNGRGTSFSLVSDQLDSTGNGALRLSCSLDKLQTYDARTPKGEFTVLYNPLFAFGGEYGTPQVPVITRLVQIPFGAEFRVEIKSYDAKEYPLAKYGITRPVFPRQPSAPKDGSKVPFVYEPSAYVSKGNNGPPLTSFQEIGVMRHMRLALLTVAPVKYDPTENKIVVYNNLDFEIVLSGADIAATRALQETAWSPAFEWMERMVIVPEALQFRKREAVQGYVIITDPAFVEEITSFAAWKTDQGFKVTVVSTDRFGTGKTLTEGLKEYLHGLYLQATPANPAPSFVLFVGDHEQIPAFQGQTGSHISDLYYATVTPGDFLPEFLMGRFSAKNVDQLKPQIEKTIEYEKGWGVDSSFLHEAILVAGWDPAWTRSHGWPHVIYARENYFNAAHGFLKVGFFPTPAPQMNAAKIVAEVSRGACFVNYTAHGSPTSWVDPAFTLNNLQKMGNKGKYPFVIGNCCLTNKFEVDTCLGEAWLRTKDAGAIGYVGGSDSTFWDEDLWWGVGLYAIVMPNDEGMPPSKEQTGPGALDCLFEEKGISNAGVMLAGNLAVESSPSSRKQYYWEIYHLMGDPSLKTRTPR